MDYIYGNSCLQMGFMKRKIYLHIQNTLDWTIGLQKIHLSYLELCRFFAFQCSECQKHRILLKNCTPLQSGAPFTIAATRHVKIW